MHIGLLRAMPLATVLLAAPVLPAAAGPAEDLATCITADEITFDAAIDDACGRYVESGEGSAAERADAFFGRARSRAAYGDYDAAIEYLGQAIELRPTGDEYVYRGGYRSMNDDDDGAMADFERAAQDFPSADTYLARGQELFFDAQYEKAISDFDAALKFAPDNGDALRLRAKSYAELGRTDDAIAAFDALLAVEPRNSDGLGLRAGLYMAKGDAARAAAEYTEAIAIYPTATEFYSGRAAAYTALRQHDKALEDWKVVVTKSQTSANYLDLGRAYAAVGDAGEADGAYQKAMGIAAGSLAQYSYGGFFAQRAEVYLAMNRYYRALADYNSAIVTSTEPANFYLGRAKVYEAMGNATAADADRAKAKQLKDALASDAGPTGVTPGTTQP